MNFIVLGLLTINFICSMTIAAPISQNKIETNSQSDGKRESVLMIANHILQELSNNNSTKSTIIEQDEPNTNIDDEEDEHIGYIPVITYVYDREWNDLNELMPFYDQTEDDENIFPKEYSPIIY